MVIKNNFRPRFLIISLKKKGHHLKLLPGNALFLLKMQWSPIKKSSLQTSLRFLTFRPKFAVLSKITQKNGSSSQICLRFYPEQVIFLIELNDNYLIAQKFVMQFLKIWSCNPWLACPDRTPLICIIKK